MNEKHWDIRRDGLVVSTILQRQLAPDVIIVRGGILENSLHRLRRRWATSGSDETVSTHQP